MLTIRVHFPGQLERFRRGEICVGCGDGQDDGVGVGHILHAQLADLELNIRRLVPDRHLGHARKVDQGQVDHTGRKYFDVDGLWTYALERQQNRWLCGNNYTFSNSHVT